MLIAIGFLLVLLIVFGPQLWVKHVLKKHHKQRSEIPGTGGELARHLLDRFELDDVEVKETSQDQDFYDPLDRVVGLSPEVMRGKSLTAVAVAAHEVGHAIQHHEGYAPLEIRTRLAQIAMLSERIGTMILLTLPLITALSRSPIIGAIALIAGFAILGMPVLLHLLSLPVEFDASFKRALPLLESGYVPTEEMPAARQILTACALTYVAASLATLLNLWRWIAILRR